MIYYQKNFIFLGDFNADLLKYDEHAETKEFLGSLSFSVLFQYILHARPFTNNT